jgi:ferritin-like metal-binding protein YciE
MKKLESLEDLLMHEMQDLYSAEKQLTKALPKMAKAAQSPELKAAFEEHLRETEGHVDRLERAFEILGEKAKAKTCKGMEGLIKEGKEVIDEEAESSVHDAALIAAAQKVEHYEIGGYGTIATFAKLLGQSEVESLLKETLDEEKAADEKLTRIAMRGINIKAARGEERAAGNDMMGRSRRVAGGRGGR